VSESPLPPVLVIEQDLPLRGDGLVGRILAAHGLPRRTLRVWEDGLDGIDPRELAGIVALGGTQHAWDEQADPFLADQRRLLAGAHAADVPVLGICLGAQVLARALGADVHTSERAERGWCDVELLPAASEDPVLGPAGGAARVYQWHQDAFSLPAGATLLARSPGVPVQAFRHGCSWAVQFHPEVDQPLLTAWMASFPDAAREAGLDGAALRAEGEAREPAVFDTFAARLIDGFVRVVADRARRRGARPGEPCAAPAAP
jgi:GMP synthase (glutamine-hydrolysing)